MNDYLGFYWQRRCIDEVAKMDNPAMYMGMVFDEYDKVTTEHGSGKDLLRQPAKGYIQLMEKKWKIVFETLFKNGNKLKPVEELDDIRGWPV